MRHVLLAVATAVFLSTTATYSGPASQSNVVIVGAGIAGLTERHKLQEAGIPSTIYEANHRIGGRIWSKFDTLTGRTTNAGAELVDSSHKLMLSLLDEYKIPLIDRHTTQYKRANEFIFENKVMTWPEVESRMFAEDPKVMARIAADAERILDQKRRHVTAPGSEFTPADVSLDQMTIQEYLDKIEAKKFQRAFFTAAFPSETGVGVREESARLIFDNMTVHPRQKTVGWLPHNDQKYIIAGGSQHLTDALAKTGTDPIQVEHKLLSIHSNDQKTYTLVFQTPTGPETVVTDHLTTAMPLSALRDVDIQVKGMPEELLQAIQKTSYGEHTKLLMYFKDRVWKDKYKHSGDVMSDQGFQIWDSSYGQKGKTGVLTAYFGELIDDKDVEAKAKMALQQMEVVFPGVSQSYIKVIPEKWPHSYSGGFRAGEYTGLLRKFPRVGNWWLIGEHASEKQYGYMEGAAETGVRAAKEIAADIETSPHAPANLPCETGYTRLRANLNALARGH